MPRLVMMALLGLTIAIGSIVGVLAWGTMSFTPASADLATADPAIGYAFYDGIEQILAGKDPAAFRQVLAPGFVDHGGGANADRTATELIDELTSLGQTFPNATLVVNDIEPASGTLVASVAPMTLSGATVGGVPFAMQASTPAYEVLRVRSGKVVERWSEGAPAVEVRTFDDMAFIAGGTFAGTTRLDRFDLQKHTEVELRVQGSTVLMGEAGVTRVAMNWMTEYAAPQFALIELPAGETLRLPGGALVRLEPAGDEPARLLRFVIQQAQPGEPFPPTLTGNATDKLLQSSVLPVLGDGHWNVSFGQLLLPADSDGKLTPSVNDSLLLCTDTGSIEILARGGEVSAMGSNHWPEEIGATGTIDSDTALRISGATSIDLHITATTPAWLIVISRNDSASPPGPSGTPLAE